MTLKGDFKRSSSARKKTFILVFCFGISLASFYLVKQMRKSAFREANLSSIQKNIHIAVDCKVFDVSGRLIRSLPHYQCIFLEDGKVVTTDTPFTEDFGVKFWNTDGNLIWKKPIVVHHTINLCRDNSAVAVITSQNKMIDGKNTRGDGFTILDLNGNTLYNWNVFDHYHELDPILHFIREPVLHWEMMKKYFAPEEITHANSIYEIPDNSLSDKIGAFKKGNFIVSNLAQHLVILSSQLNDVLWISKKKYMSHDVKVLENGNVLLFDNNYPSSEKARILEINPIDESVVWSYRGEAGLNAPIAGSVAQENGFLAVTGNPDLKHVSLINREGETIFSFGGESISKTGIFRLQILKHDGFLKHQLQ